MNNCHGMDTSGVASPIVSLQALKLDAPFFDRATIIRSPEMFGIWRHNDLANISHESRKYLTKSQCQLSHLTISPKSHEISEHLTKISENLIKSHNVPQYLVILTNADFGVGSKTHQIQLGLSMELAICCLRVHHGSSARFQNHTKYYKHLQIS